MQTEPVARPRHVLIYGPPAAGKLTVARMLASMYGFRVLDNHVSLDPALRLFDFGTPELAELVERLRVELLMAAARAGLDVVSTLVFAHPLDREHVARLVEASESGGATVVFVQLLPKREVLECRALEPSRAATHKIHDLATLGRTLERYDLTTPIHDSDLALDNTDMSPAEVAHLITLHAGMGRA
jgi:predicted kinase